MTQHSRDEQDKTATTYEVAFVTTSFIGAHKQNCLLNSFDDIEVEGALLPLVVRVESMFNINTAGIESTVVVFRTADAAMTLAEYLVGEGIAFIFDVVQPS